MSREVDWAAADLREQLEKKYIDGEAGAVPAAVLADRKRLVDFMVRLVRGYDPTHHSDLPDDVRDTVMFQTLKDRMESHRGYDALRHGDHATMRHMAGTTSDRVDATGYDRLINACKPAAHQILVKGPKGSGKTTKIIDIARRLVAEGVVDKVLTNIDGPQEHPAVDFSEDISRFLEFAKDPGEKLAILDEFSTTGNAYTGQYEVENVLSRVINAFRKSEGGSMRTAYLGHENDKDIHPLVRKQSDVVIRADGKEEEGLIDKATVYKGWQAYQQDDDWFSVRGLRDIPDDSPWSFDTNYFAHLEFDLDNPEKQIQRGQIIDNWEVYQEDDDGETTVEKMAQDKAEDIAEDLAQDQIDQLVAEAYDRLDSQRDVANVLGLTRNEVRGALDRVAGS